MSGPLARSAHMRMKMKREKEGITSPRSAPGSPAVPSDSKPVTPAAKELPAELLLAATLASAATDPTADSEVSERGDELVAQAPAQSECQPPSPSLTRSSPDLSRQQPAQPQSVRSTSRSRNRARMGINSLETEAGGDVVDSLNSTTGPSPRARSKSRETPPQQRAKNSDQFANYRMSPTVFDFPHQQQNRSINTNLSPTSSPHYSSNPRSVYSRDNHQQIEVAPMQKHPREQLETVRRQNEISEHHRRREQQQFRQSPREMRGRQQQQQFAEDAAFDPFAPSPVTVPTENPRRAASPFNANTDGMRDAYFEDDANFGSFPPNDVQQKSSQFQQNQQSPRQFPQQQSPRQYPQAQPNSFLAKAYSARGQSPRYNQFSPRPIDTAPPQHELDPTEDVYSPNHKDGSQMMTIEGNDNFVYMGTSEEQHDGGADLEYHTNADEEYKRGDQVPALVDDSRDYSREELGYDRTSSNQTVDSEQALTGTPIRKKTQKPKKKRSSKKGPKFVIENVDSADSFDRSRSDPRYAIHNNSSSQDEEDEENVRPPKITTRGYSHKYNEMAATARRYADLDGGGRVVVGKNFEQEKEVVQLRKKQALASLSPQDTDDEDECSESRKVVLPQRVEMSRSWDSKGEEVRPIQSSKSWDTPTENEVSIHHGWRNKNSPSKKQRNLWAEEYDDNEKSPLRHRHFIGASKSWDYDANKNTSNGDFNLFESGPFGSTPTRESKKVEQNGVAQWHEQRADYAGEHSPGKMSDAPSDKPARHEDDMDLDKVIGTKKMPNIPTEFETTLESSQVSDFDDEDSIFAFEKKEEVNVKAEPPLPPPVNPIDIFAKINSGLKQADNVKNRALRSPRAGDNGSVKAVDSDVANDASEQHSKPEKRNVAFAKERHNTIHRYLVEDSNFDSKSNSENPSNESTSGEEDADGEWEDIDDNVEETATRSVPIKAASLTSPSDPQPKEKKTTISEGSVSPKRSRDSAISEKSSQKNQSSSNKKSVHDQSDDDTYNSNAESSMGSSFKSNRSGATQEKELNLLEHVDNAFNAVASSLGGLFGSPKNNANDNKVEEGKSFATDENTMAQSTLPSEAPTEQSDDWFGYMERVLFPTKEETQKDFGGNRSVNSESDYTESQYTESVYTESEGHSKFTDYDESYADEDDEDDAYLLQQALAAARAVHHIHGVEYDETQELDVLTDVKFHVVNVKLPLGQHEIGAWVSRVVPDGNGARKGVQHGDQLAAINAKSAVHASIDEVAATISRTPNKQSVELTFLRYVGPLRPVPGAVIQEGFEVTDASVNKKKSPPKPPKPPKSPLQSPSKKNSRFFKSISPPTSPKLSSSTKESPRSPKLGSSKKNVSESPKKRQSSKQKPPSSPCSPSRITEQVTASPDREAVIDSNNCRNNQKKKSVLGKFKSFTKKK